MIHPYHICILLLTFGFVHAGWITQVRGAESGQRSSTNSWILEVAGVLNIVRTGESNWVAAKPGDGIGIGDRVRTGPQSRAAIQFSDRSVVRLGENTTLQVQAPRNAERRRWGLLEGILYFFNRERASEIEFDTPVSSGSIRGTEFTLDFKKESSTLTLGLMDGAVELTAANTALSLGSGEQATVIAGAAPTKSPLLQVNRLVQWALYYPSVLVPTELSLDEVDQRDLASVLELYASGDLLAAQREMQSVPKRTLEREYIRAALMLSVGDVEGAEVLLASIGNGHPAAKALRELIQVVRDRELDLADLPPANSPSRWLARSYTLQASFQPKAALEAASRACRLAPDSGHALARRAELEFILGLNAESGKSLDEALVHAPRLATARSLRGFVLLERRQPEQAFREFEAAIALDAALGSAWIGRGSCEVQLGRRTDALRSFQVAVALEPTRSSHRSHLGKLLAHLSQDVGAQKELLLAQKLDPKDPTASLYQALLAWQQSRPNEAISQLERSISLNNNQRLFRSALGLDRDLSVRNAHLAALYRDAGLPELGHRSATAAVAEDYANHSAHLFLARTYQQLEDPRRFDLRHEGVRQSELLMASLLAPAGSPGLSLLALQPEHVEWFLPKPISFTTFSQYRDTGDWIQEASIYGGMTGFSYALDTSVSRLEGLEPNARLDREDVSLQWKQQLSDVTELWSQWSYTHADMGDVARRLDPAQGTTGFHADEKQAPNLRLGLRHQWSASSQTLFLLGRLTDSLDVRDPQPGILFLRQASGTNFSLSTVPFFDSQFESQHIIYSAELQHLWQAGNHSVVTGGRAQIGSVENSAWLSRGISGPLPREHVDESTARTGVYLYDTWHVWEPLRLVAGIAYDRVTVPTNSELPPLTAGQRNRSLVEPKLGFLYAPWKRGLFRGAWTRSLGGYAFDDNLRLEPAHVAGFVQSFRSLVPESIVGIVPATEFETLQMGFDQSLESKTHLGLELSRLTSDGERVVGVLKNVTPLPIPDSPNSTLQTLDYEERSAAAYAVQRWGDGWALGIRYQRTEAELTTRFPEVPPLASSPPGIGSWETIEESTLQKVGLSLDYQHTSGFFARWESTWYDQDSLLASQATTRESVWQHDVLVGWRFYQRRLQVQAGIQNLANEDYRLNPLNEFARMPRRRAVFVSLRFEF